VHGCPPPRADWLRPLGALRFRFFPDSELFVVESVVDDGCRIVADFFNETRPDFPKDRLQTNNTLNVRFGSSGYRVHFVHDSGLFKLRFGRA